MSDKTHADRYTPEHLTPYERPRDYAGAHFPEYYTVYGVYHGSDTLAQSNWRVLLRACGFTAERLSTGEIRTNAPDGHAPDLVIVTRAGHCAVGWVDTLRVHQDAPAELLQRLDDMIGSLNDDPILDWSDYSELEWNEAREHWEHMSVRDRAEMIRDLGPDAGISVFAARRAEMPEDPAGRLYEALALV